MVGAGGERLTTIGFKSEVEKGFVAEGDDISSVDGGLSVTLPLGVGGGCDHTGGGGLISIFGLDGAGVDSLNTVGFCVGFLVGLSVVFIISITLSKLDLRKSLFGTGKLEHLMSWQSRTKTLLTVSMNG